MVVRSAKLTAKRQATLPAELCRDLGVGPGDRLLLERRLVDGESVWVIQAETPHVEMPWFGALRGYANGKSHDMEDIRRSIGRREEKAE